MASRCRVRSSNYKYEEIEKLIRNLEDRPEFVAMMGDFKNVHVQKDVWEDIAADISRGGTLSFDDSYRILKFYCRHYRSGYEVKKKWQDLKTRVKYKAKTIEEHERLFGDDYVCPLSLDPLQKRVLALMNICPQIDNNPTQCESDSLSTSKCSIYYIEPEDTHIKNTKSTAREVGTVYNSQPVLLVPVYMKNCQDNSYLDENDAAIEELNPNIETAIVHKTVEVPDIEEHSPESGLEEDATEMQELNLKVTETFSLNNVEVPAMNGENSLQSGLEKSDDGIQESDLKIARAISLKNAEVSAVRDENFLQTEKSCNCSKRKSQDLDEEISDSVYDMFMGLNKVHVQQTTEIREMHDILLKLVKLEEAKLKIKCKKYDLNFKALID